MGWVNLAVVSPRVCRNVSTGAGFQDIDEPISKGRARRVSLSPYVCILLLEVFQLGDLLFVLAAMEALSRTNFEK